MDYTRSGLYEIIDKRELKDINANGIYLKHVKSGARVMLIECDDDNKVFNIAFRTPPEDSTGVAHIIEHSVLCGSSKYPVKDPFVELEKGSFKTFLNAMTFPDKTMYPVASTNEKELFNLADVYLDAVFHPAIYREKRIFMQEGWSYRMEDKDSPLEISGVVYSEMKGVFSSPDDVLEHRVMESLYPDSQYSVESGGDPEYIPDLTYEDFIDFHRKYYHPSNSYIFVYGNGDMEKMLDFLDDGYLKTYDRAGIVSDLRYQDPTGGFIERSDEYPVESKEDEKGGTYLTYNMITGDSFDQKALAALEVIDYALVSAPGAPLRERLLAEGIGNDVFGVLTDGILQPYYSVVARNADEEQKDRFLEIIKEEFQKAADEGLNTDSLLARLNFLDFQFREGDYGVYPKGIMYSIQMMETWLYDENRPFDALSRIENYRSLKKECIEHTGYFEDMIRTRLLGCGRSSLVSLIPKAGLAGIKEEALKEKLRYIRDAMTDEEIESIVENTKDLREYQKKQDTKEELDRLPKLSIGDVVRKAREYRTEETQLSCGIGDVKLLFHEKNANGIVYVTFMFPLENAEPEDVFYAGLLRSVLQKMNTAEHTYLDLSNIVNLKTGGISFGIPVYEDRNDTSAYKAYFVVRVKALAENVSDALDIIKEIVNDTCFDDTERLYQIISEKWTAMKNVMQQAGHSTAVNRALAYGRGSYAYADANQGITFFDRLDRIYRNYEMYKEETVSGLKDTAEKVFSGKEFLVSITGDRTDFESVAGKIEDTAASVFEKYGTDVKKASSKITALGKLNEGFTTPGQVQYVAICGNFKDLGYKYSGKLLVLRHMLNFGYIWDRVRVDGNAYGCGCAFDRNGRTSFMSYRDPHIKRTYDTYMDVGSYLRGLEISEDDVERNIIGTLSETDIPLTPSMYGQIALKNHMIKVTNEELQKERDEIFDTKPGDISSFGTLIEDTVSSGGICVVGSSAKINEHSDMFNSIRPLTGSDSE